MCECKKNDKYQVCPEHTLNIPWTYSDHTQYLSFFYTFSGLKILHSKVRKFATKIASRQNSVNHHSRAKFHIYFKQFKSWEEWEGWLLLLEPSYHYWVQVASHCDKVPPVFVLLLPVSFNLKLSLASDLQPEAASSAFHLIAHLDSEIFEGGQNNSNDRLRQ